MDVSVSHKMLNCETLKSPSSCAFVLGVLVFLIFANTLMISNPGDIITSVVYNEAPKTPTDVYEAPQSAPPPDTQVQSTAQAPDTQVQSTSNTTMPAVDATTENKTQENSWPSPNAQTITNEENEGDDEARDPLNPPSKLKRDERAEWFRRNAPSMKILKSKDSGERFHARVLQFFDQNCTSRFFMTWLSPVRTFGPREFLAVDSLLKANPEGCLMILSTSLDSRRGYRVFKPLLDRGLKIVAVKPDLPFLVKNTPAETWLDEIRSGERYPGAVSFTIHLSDLIRLAILYRYGGIYLDTDFIVLNDIKGLRNALGIQTMYKDTQKWKAVNGAVLVFDIAHPILFQFLEDYATNFKGDRWGQNGPDLLSRVIRRLEREGTPGYNITILPTKAFYPVDWNHINRFFWEPKTENETKWVEDELVELNGQSYALHLWNKITRKFVIQKGSVLQRLIAAHCSVCLDSYNN